MIAQTLATSTGVPIVWLPETSFPVTAVVVAGIAFAAIAFAYGLRVPFQASEDADFDTIDRADSNRVIFWCFSIAAFIIAGVGGIANGNVRVDEEATTVALANHYGIEMREELWAKDGARLTVVTSDGELIDARITMDEDTIALYRPTSDSAYVELSASNAN